MLPYLARDRKRFLTLPPFRPGRTPLTELAKVVADALGRPADYQSIRAELLSTEPGTALARAVETLTIGEAREATLLVAIDQFEEIFTVADGAERESFLRLLAAMTARTLPMLAVATVRSDLLGEILEAEDFRIAHEVFTLGVLPAERLPSVIDGPAQIAAVNLEDGLVRTILDDVGRTAEALPLLAFTLRELYERFGDDKKLTRAEYELLGDPEQKLRPLENAVRGKAEETLRRAAPSAEELAALKEAFVGQLVRVNEEGVRLRRPAKMEDIPEAARRLVRLLVEARLLATRAEDGAQAVEVTHEALFKAWPLLSRWLEEEQDFLTGRRQIEEAERFWRGAPEQQKDRALLTGLLLEKAREWSLAWPERLRGVREFVLESVKGEEEAPAAAAWRRLNDAAERHSDGAGDLLTGLTLASTANWWDQEKPTSDFALRFGGDFDRAWAFLRASEEAEEVRRRAEDRTQRRRRTTRLISVAVIVVLCIITPLTLFAGYMAWHASNEAARANQEANAAEDAKALAERQRQDAEKARAQADQQRRNAEAARAEADASAAEATSQAEKARQSAEAQRQAAEQAMQAQAEAQRQADEAAKQEAIARAALQQAEEERQRAETARAEFQGVNLQLFASRVTSLQQDGVWETAANYLGSLWQEITGPGPSVHDTWLTTAIIQAFARQQKAEYPIYPAFLNYSGFTGSTDTTGRFRVYDLDRKPDNVTTDSQNNIIGIYDAITGAVTGTFDMPSGTSLGSDADLVTPDGKRAAILTSDPNTDNDIDERQIVLWSAGAAAATMVALPKLEGKIALEQLAPIHSDGRFALYFTKDGDPGEVAVVDPNTQDYSFSMLAADLAKAAGVDSIASLNLLGLAGDHLIVLVNSADDGRVLSIDVSSNDVASLAPKGGVLGAALTPDGATLLTMTCPQPCGDQNDLAAFDMNRVRVMQWVERVPSDLTLSPTAVEETTVDGKAVYSILVQNSGSSIVFQVPKDEPQGASAPEVVRLEGNSVARFGDQTYDGNGGYRTIEDAGTEATLDGVRAAGILANYRVPVDRQKLSYYVAPSSLAVYYGDNGLRLAGITYDGDLVVYRLRSDGLFEDDPNFDRVNVGESNCVSAIGFGGDGNSVLIRHVDGALRYVVRSGVGVDWRSPTSSSGEALQPPSEAPRTQCDAPDTSAHVISERIVAANPFGTRFALLDKTGAVYWLNIVEQVSGQQVRSRALNGRATSAC